MLTVDEYIIQQKTLALLPSDGGDGSLQSIVLEEERKLCCRKAPLQIVQDSCIYFGSTYSGRKKSARDMGFKSMPPVCVCNELGIFFIPLMAEVHRGCAWFAHSHVLNWVPGKRRSVVVELSNQEFLTVQGNASSFGKKIMRAAQYRLQLSKRIVNGRDPIPRAGAECPIQLLQLRLNEQGTYYMEA